MDSEPFPLSNSLCITHWENYRSQTLPTDSTDQPFFKGDVVSIEKTPKRATAGLDPSFAQFYERLVQSQIRLFAHHSQNLRRKYFQRRDAPAAGFRRGAPLLIPALQPFYRRRHAHLEIFGGFMARRTRLDGFNHAFPQVTRIGLRHLSPP